ncbi:UxaA family hydrolase [Ammoniphilus sp. 3BR4]|uniref:UxaA family hydrolase n=1 Tax=Ammoniphilus sp. 3BR4 TaxID=3158265 RepID=UPI0034663161
MATFKGYRRPNGTVGVRNSVIVINTVGELAGITRKLAELVPGVVPVVHQLGRSQFPEDAQQTLRTLYGTACHPNVAAALFVGLGHDDPAQELAEMMQEAGWKAHALSFQQFASVGTLLAEGRAWLEEALAESRQAKRELADTSELIIGLECGASDAWSGITANPAIGVLADLMVADGGTVVLSETTEAIGAEHILARSAANQETAEKFLRIVATYEARMRAIGEDVRACNPTPGNIRGGLTTLEEKSLGCIKKGGSTPLVEVVGYAERPTRKGLVFMDTPGFDAESVAGLAAGGAQIILFSTGRGSPTGSPIVPVIKIGTNPKLYERMPQHIDVNAGTILEGLDSLDGVGRKIYEQIISVADGELTAAEKHGHHEFSIWRLAETI